MRLIDADETIKQYTQIFVEKYGAECGEMFQGVLKQMPTAYDVDKVVEKIQKIPFRSASAKARIIHIVKGGGVDVDITNKEEMV